MKLRVSIKLQNQFYGCMDFSVIYYIKWLVVAFFSGNPMHSVNPMSVKVMHDCIPFGSKLAIFCVLFTVE